MTQLRHMWVFNGAPWQLPGGVFSTLEVAEHWISSNRLSGILTGYPLDVGVYDWAVLHGISPPEGGEKITPEYIGRFSHASLEHYHYEDGECVGEGVTVEQRSIKQSWERDVDLPPIIWLFNGDNQPLASGAFSSLKKAEEWVQANHLSGTLTQYPVDSSLYTWAVQNNLIEPCPDKEKEPEFIQRFTYAGQERYKYNNGVRETSLT